jgi:AcrR family transcriptional regulator
MVVAGERAKTKERTRRRLIGAATSLFAKKGIDRPSLDEICAEAGVTRGAFYVHFDDRDDLLAAVMEDSGARFLEALFGVDLDAQGLFAAFARAMATGDYPLTRRGGMRPHQLLDACARSKTIRKRYTALVEDAVRRLADRLVVDQAAGRLRKDIEPVPAATLLLMTAIGAHTLVDLDLPLDQASLVGALATLLTR